MPARVLVVDDDLHLAETLAEGLTERGLEAAACASSVEAIKRLETEPFEALVTDLRMPAVDGMGLLARSRASAPERPVIVMTAYAAVETAIEAIRQGAYHYLTKPFLVDELALFVDRAIGEARLRREARTLRSAMRHESALDHLVGASAAMREVFDVVTRVADAATPVLFIGETGTGKTALARAMHGAGARAERPFVSINCASLPESLLESELFGHVKGAFTGATSSRDGLVAEAAGGTLLLDEIGEMSPTMQAKLLHVLESGTVRSVGANKERRVDVRLVAATHRDLRERIRAGAFREDLLYRLDVVTIEIPPLRQRRDDIPLLALRTLERAKAAHPRSSVERLSPDAMTALVQHSWPGNVRELTHAIERVVLLGRSAEATVGDLPPTVTAAAPPNLPDGFGQQVQPIRDVQRRYAAWALERFGGHKRRTAEALGVDAKTLAKWLSDDPDA
jgi:two-component system response regulator HydG